MYEFPYGGEQQLNLNWIINEIITLHKRLDPDYELPNFDNAFPYMNLNQLNLDWILRELKAIKDLAPSEDAQLLKMVANALIANTYDAETQYSVDDIVYRDSDNRLYKCIAATPAGGEPFDNNKWVEIDVGEVLTDLLTNQTTPVEPYDSNPAMDGTASAGTSTQYARGDHVHPKDTARVPTSRTVNGKALSGNITLNASDIPNDSNVAGDNVDDALNTLDGAIDDEKERVIMLADGTQIAANTNFNTLTAYGNYYVTMTSEAATMPNIPIQRAGRLIVRASISDGTSYVGQIFIPYFGAMAYFRDTNNNGATWSDWETFSNLRGEIVEYLEPKMQASRAYAKGDYLDYGGTLYKALAAISNQDTLTVGTNVIATTVCAELLTKIDKTISRGVVALDTNYLVSGGLIEYYEIGDIIIVTGKDIAFVQTIPNSTEGNNINLTTDRLPPPSSNTVFLANYMADVEAGRATQRFRIKTDGKLSVWWNNAIISTTNTCFFTTIYKRA